MIFKFILEPQTTADMLYNLALFDSIFALAYLGYLEIRRIFGKLRGGAGDVTNSK